jgi:hypothetical protein
MFMHYVRMLHKKSLLSLQMGEQEERGHQVRKRRHKQTNQGNLEFKEKERERNVKNCCLKVLEFEALNGSCN